MLPGELAPFQRMALLPPTEYPAWRVELSMVGLCPWAGRNRCHCCNGVLTEPYEWESGLFLHRSCLLFLNPHLNPDLELSAPLWESVTAGAKLDA